MVEMQEARPQRRILVVEDDRDFAESLADMLEPLGYTVRIAPDETAALSAIAEFDADLAFVDVRLGRSNGIELVGSLRTRAPELLCVMMTAYASIETAVDALHAGAYDYLSKPFHPDELFALLRRAYERIDLHDQRARAEQALLESEERFRNLIDGSVQGVYIHRDLKLIYVNQAFARMLGYDHVEEVLALGSLSETIDRADWDRLHGYWKARASGRHSPESYEYLAVRRDGSRIHLQNVVRKVRWAGADAVQATVLNISERKRAEEELRRSRERFRDFAEASADWFWETDANLRFTYVSGHDEEQHDAPHQLKGATLEEVFATRIKDSEMWARVVNDVNLHLPLGEFEIDWPNDDGSPSVLRITGKPVFDDDRAFQGFRGTGRDVTEAYFLSEELSYQATHDALTGLVNRRDFERRLQRIIDTARSHRSDNALCYLDLDQFKVINDTCGHQAGDELLRQLAVILGDQIRKRDTLARLGGDEFGVLMEHCSLGQAERVANAVRLAIEDFRFMWEDKSFSLGVSIGLVPIDGTSDSTARVLSMADAACYAAKDRGRNRIHVYRHDDEELHLRYGEMQWVAEINRALEDQRLMLACQPIVRVSDGQDHGAHYELLLRMRDEHGELIPPGAFLPAAERYSLTSRIDRWVISNALARLREHPRHLDELYLCTINVSGPSLGDDEFLAFAAHELQTSGVPPEKICFEVTETAAISNLSNATGFIRALNGLGCKFALDDFGSGLSSFAYLKNLPVDFIKIDGMFVKDILDDPIDLAMVRSIAEIGQVMGKHTVAEFVENTAVLERLGELGVDFAQGYGIGKPEPFLEFLERRGR
jgi:diguanylate cyclase (GGDEF)-like protein/PAS domain S-box-containing protein